ncbi:MAG: hypothetical protein JW940_11150, partial [Polyangiaceae bacterium]|nr:hypothetical protein [Polyangiaceae bacterium]
GPTIAPGEPGADAPMLSRDPVMHFVSAKMQLAEERALRLKSISNASEQLRDAERKGWAWLVTRETVTGVEGRKSNALRGGPLMSPEPSLRACVTAGGSGKTLPAHCRIPQSGRQLHRIPAMDPATGAGFARLSPLPRLGRSRVARVSGHQSGHSSGHHGPIR